VSLASWFRKLLSPRSAPLKAELGRNEPCWCGSGKKYKKCHLAKDKRDRFEAAHAARVAAMKGRAKGRGPM
jgi:uncharacterized protein YecA (UPF0149 family)